MEGRKHEQGFTLIELVVVILILGILAAIAVPKFEDIRGQARISALRGSLDTIRGAISIQTSKNLLNGLAAPGYPTTIDASMFSNNAVPKEPHSGSGSVVYSGAYTGAGGWIYYASVGRVIPNGGAAAYTAY
ncbi:MAG: type II secretion system protein [Candidatus Eisenbacteria bacterium]|nr:type II secretion system protein [Candidatus Eisenbacteria bacterium]